MIIAFLWGGGSAANVSIVDAGSFRESLASAKNVPAEHLHASSASAAPEPLNSCNSRCNNLDSWEYGGNITE